MKGDEVRKNYYFIFFFLFVIIIFLIFGGEERVVYCFGFWIVGFLVLDIYLWVNFGKEVELVIIVVIWEFSV